MPCYGIAFGFLEVSFPDARFLDLTDMDSS